VANARKNGRIALIVAVDTYTQVDLPRIRIRPEEAHEAQNGVDRKALQTLEHRKSPSPRTLRGGEIDITRSLYEPGFALASAGLASAP